MPYLCYVTAQHIRNCSFVGGLEQGFVHNHLIISFNRHHRSRDVSYVCENDHKAYLWCQVEPEMAVVGQAILDQKRNFIAQAQLDVRVQTSSFAEVDKILQREGQCYWLRQVDRHILLVIVHIAALSKGD